MYRRPEPLVFSGGRGSWACRATTYYRKKSRARNRVEFDEYSRQRCRSHRLDWSDKSVLLPVHLIEGGAQAKAAHRLDCKGVLRQRNRMVFVVMYDSFAGDSTPDGRLVGSGRQSEQLTRRGGLDVRARLTMGSQSTATLQPCTFPYQSSTAQLQSAGSREYCKMFCKSLQRIRHQSTTQSVCTTPNDQP